MYRMFRVYFFHNFQLTEKQIFIALVLRAFYASSILYTLNRRKSIRSNLGRL